MDAVFSAFKQLLRTWRGLFRQDENADAVPPVAVIPSAKAVPPVVEQHMRKAWKPVIQPGDGPLTASKFSGRPWLREDEGWPHCPHCGQPMQFFLQLDLSEVPEPARGEFGTGLLQLFYCTNSDPMCEVECNAFFPFAESELVRNVQPGNGAADVESPTFECPFPAKLIIGWELLKDCPNWEEGEELGIHLSDDEWDALAEQGFPLAGDKLAGWPMWIQSVEYPDCPVCGEKMRLVFQLDSDDSLPYMFGDAGCAHITQCVTHKDKLAFGWACS